MHCQILKYYNANFAVQMQPQKIRHPTLQCQILAGGIMIISREHHHQLGHHHYHLHLHLKFTLHCQILAGGIITSMQMGHSSSFLAESTINGTSPVYKRKFVRMLQNKSRDNI